MNIVLLCHPDFAASQSMPRFAGMLEEAYKARGHQVVRWSPAAKAYAWLEKSRLKKWAGYVDQYLLFPRQVRRKLRGLPRDTLFVFCDQALGPWVPLVQDRPHVVHAHDLLALRSAMGLIPENPTASSGRAYQQYIRRGFRQAKHFISISKKTRDDLHRYGLVQPVSSDVVYNGLNFPYAPMAGNAARSLLESAGLPATDESMLLHVGGGQWYKNRVGLIEWYAAYAARELHPLPLWCISPEPVGNARAALDRVPRQGRVLFFRGLHNRTLQAAYSYARAFLFPSLAEGFGWPIVEAQACGCPVITTDEAPMTEVGGNAAYYLPRLQAHDDIAMWAAKAADVLQDVLRLTTAQRAALIERGVQSAQRFNADAAIDAYLIIYQRVLGERLQAAGKPVRAETML